MKEIFTVAVGILVILLLLSAFVSGLVKLITGLMNMKAKKLDLALRNMLASSDVHETVYQAFRDHSLYRLQVENPNRKNSLPSELKPEDFTIILMDVVCQGNPVYSPDEMMNYIQQLPDPDLKVVLRSLLRDANNDLNMFKANIMRWYQTVLERAEAWQQQSVGRFSMALALLIAIVFNVDVIQIFNRLQANPQHLQQAVALAENLNLGQAPANEASGSYGFPPPGAVSPSATPDEGASSSYGFPPPAPGSYPPPAAGQVYPSTSEELQRAIDQELRISRSPFGLGWAEIDISRMSTIDWLLKFLGWGIATLGIGMGAPTLLKLGQKIGDVISRRNSGMPIVSMPGPPNSY